MSTVRVLSGVVEPIAVYVTDLVGSGLAGKTDIKLKIVRISDGYALDFDDGSFKASGWTQLNSDPLSELNVSAAAGYYKFSGVDFTTVTNETADDNYIAIPIQDGGTDAFLPESCELKVDQWVADLSSGSTAAAYQDAAIWIDTNNGVSGTTIGIGTAHNPVDNLADALTIADDTNLRAFVIVEGDLTLTANLNEWSVELKANSTLDAGGFSVNNTTVTGGTFKGSMSGTVVVRNALLEDVTGFLGRAEECGLSGSIELGVGESTFARCHSETPGTGTPELDFVGAGRTANVRAYSGGLEVQNMTDAGNTASLEYVAGQCIIDSSCTAGTLVVRGLPDPITNGATGTTVIVPAYLTQIKETWYIHGLDTSNPLEVDFATPAGTRQVPVDGSIIDQTVVTVGNVSTVTRV